MYEEISDDARESVDDEDVAGVGGGGRMDKSFSLISSSDLMIGGGAAVGRGDDRSIKRLLLADGRIKTRS